MKLRKEGVVFKITLLGMCLALFIVLNYASFNVPPFKFSLKGLPVIFIAVVFGPLQAALLGGVGEFFCQLISPYGLTPTTPLWVLPWVVQGIIVGLLFKHKNVKNHIFLWIFTVILCCLVVTGINTFTLWLDAKIYGYNPNLTYVTVPLRFVSSLISAVLYGLLIPVFFEPLIKQGKFETEN